MLQFSTSSTCLSNWNHHESPTLRTSSGSNSQFSSNLNLFNETTQTSIQKERSGTVNCTNSNSLQAKPPCQNVYKLSPYSIKASVNFFDSNQFTCPNKSLSLEKWGPPNKMNPTFTRLRWVIETCNLLQDFGRTQPQMSFVQNYFRNKIQFTVLVSEVHGLINSEVFHRAILSSMTKLAAFKPIDC